MLENTPRSPKTFSPRERRRRIFALAIALVPPIGSLAFNLGVRLPVWGCPLLRYVGVPCPAWGLTRSLTATLRGDINQALSYHLFGPLVLAGFAIAALHFTLELIRNQRLNYFYVRGAKNPQFQIFCFLILLGYHAARLQKMWEWGELYRSFINSPLGNLIMIKTP